MIDITAGYDFSEDEVKFVNILVRKADGNKLVDILDIDGLKEEMEGEGISSAKLEELSERMQDHGILQYNSVMGERWIRLDSDQVIIFQAHLNRISCPLCHKRPLKRKTVTYCSACDYQADEG